MTLRRDLLALVQRVRQVPVDAGLRFTSVTIVVDTYDRAVNLSGAALVSTSSTALTPVPKVSPIDGGPASAYGGGFASSSSGGLVATGFEIGPITPDHTGGGYTPTELLPVGDVTKDVYVLLAGEGQEGSGERFEVIPGSLVVRSFRYTFRVRRAPQS